MSFKKINYVIPAENIKKDKASATVITVQQFLKVDQSVGEVIAAVSGDTFLEMVAIESIAAADARTDVTVQQVRLGDKFLATLANNSDSAHNDQLMVLSTSLVVNNTGTNSTSGVVRQLYTVGAAADKLAVVEVVAAK